MQPRRVLGCDVAQGEAVLVDAEPDLEIAVIALAEAGGAGGRRRGKHENGGERGSSDGKDGVSRGH